MELELLRNTPASLIPSFYAIILLLCIITVFLRMDSSYEKKLSIAQKLLYAFLCSLLVSTIFALIILGAGLIFEYGYRQNRIIMGSILVLLYAVVLLLSILKVPIFILKIRATSWLKIYPTACVIELNTANRHLFCKELRRVTVVSVDKVPVKQGEGMIYTGNALYLLPGAHLIEFSLYTDLKMGIRRLPIPNEKRHMEKTVTFEARKKYICKPTGRKAKVEILSKGFR